MTDKSDLLILGATGYTGRLITRYLSVHPQRKSFTFAVGARSSAKLQVLLEEFNLQSSIRTVQVDVTKPADIERAVKSTRVVINTVGPYWRWGTPVVEACAKHGVHYVDLTGEGVWIRHIILQYDFVANKTGAIIVPSCGYDSIPSDVTAYLANKTLKSLPTPLNVGTCTTVHGVKGGISGGTISSAITMIEDVPKKDARESAPAYSLSPIKGPPVPRVPLYYRLPVPGARPLIGAFFFMKPTNQALVQRTFGLLEYEARISNSKETQLSRYGPDFVYDEFLTMSSVFGAVSFTLLFGTVFFLFAFVTPFRWLAKKFLPQPGAGPSDEDMQHGYMTATNITKSTSEPPVYVKTVMKGKGDPGYLLTAIMISESALSLIFPPGSNINSPEAARAALPHLARRGGGILTPMTAFGDVLIRRLEGSGRFEFSSSVIEGDAKKRK
ncbi:hypothetical protein P691DRAFT_777529 [Macrolepiota fuliginosa MF-IS2]|uniref:Saccharopine dehydrogenase NADP binding domain-containing protein n=1 Tax=Macrolepiota fuliginosa MF-IS2 TaxID=1400762 RepID=A0A9P5X8U8_9AGAR|nr:hypothetical protein P691DRAFT_777529 [Macrolepiota fuliginosa MF-IS2]